jgi:tRNA pseudouridine13 synthase
LKSSRPRASVASQTGAHKGNDFEIVLRDVQGDESVLLQRLRLIKELGVPNYFGAQRFGHDGHNLHMADELLVQGHEIRDRLQRGFALSAARSLLFNAVLQARVEQGIWNQLLPGDLANLNGRTVFSAVNELMPPSNGASEFDIHPTGLLWGAGELRSAGRVAALETEIIGNYAALAQGLARAGLEQERRALRMWVQNFTWTLADSRLILKFRLGRGAFATAVIAELLGTAANDFGEHEDA